MLFLFPPNPPKSIAYRSLFITIMKFHFNGKKILSDSPRKYLQGRVLKTSEKLTLKGLIFMEDLLIVNISAKEIFLITGEA